VSAFIIAGATITVAIINKAFDHPSTAKSVTVRDSPNATVGVINDSPNATQNITVNRGLTKRTIPPEQAERMKSILEPFTGSTITISARIGNQESSDFADKLAKIFADSGWHVTSQWGMAAGRVPSIAVQVSPKDVFQPSPPVLDPKTGEHLIGYHPKVGAIIAAIKAGLGIDCPLSTTGDLPSGMIILMVGFAD